MIIKFFGHSLFKTTAKYRQKILDFLYKQVGNAPADMYLGGYGEFDGFAYECCKKYKETHPNVSLAFITPYLTDSYQKNRLIYEKRRYDEIIYPEIEDKPLKFAIVYRNSWMVEKADLVVCGINHRSGGAYKTYQFAKQKGKRIFNVTDIDF